MTLVRDLGISGLVATLMSFIIAGILMALRGAPASVFAEETWFILFIAVTVFGFLYAMLQSYKGPGRKSPS